MTERDRQIAQRKAQGILTHQEISKRVRCGINTVTKVIRQPEIQTLIAKLQAEAATTEIDNLHQAVNDATIDAFRTLSWLAKHAKSETVRLKASESILDRASPDIAPKRQIHAQEAGYAPSVTVNYIDMSPDQIAMFNHLQREGARSNGKSSTYLLPPSTAKLAVIHDQNKQVLAEQWVDADGKLVELDVVWLDDEEVVIK